MAEETFFKASEEELEKQRLQAEKLKQSELADFNATTSILSKKGNQKKGL